MGNSFSELTPEQAKKFDDEYEESCKRAARAIINADIMLLATGAGWSKDSGLAVYKDIADVKAYHEMGVNYTRLCDPVWLQKDPEIFYGFWGMCFNDYRNATPHEGYKIVMEWKQKFFQGENANQLVLKKLKAVFQKQELPSFLKKETVEEDKEKEGKSEESETESLQKKMEEMILNDGPAAFFIFTSSDDLPELFQ